MSKSISNSHLLLLDGATGTELDRRGVYVGLPLWSAGAMDTAPEVLKEVHLAYLNAGADAVTTNTFRTHERSLAKAGLGDRAEELTKKAVVIAQAACAEAGKQALVLGGVAPLEDCYRPDLTPDPETCYKEHSQMIQYLVDGGVDLIWIETMCAAHETLAAAQAAQNIAPGRWGVCFCFTSQGAPGVLLDGTPVEQIIPELDKATVLGINCMSATILADQVSHLRHLVPDEVAIAAYGNVGYANPDGSWVITDAVEPAQFAVYARQWHDAGANLIGGCCGTTPETIQAIKKANFRNTD